MRHATVRHMRFRGSVEATAVVLGAVARSRACSPIRYIFQFNDAGRLDTNDGRWSIWVVSWVAHALTTDPSAAVPRQHLLSAHRTRSRSPRATSSRARSARRSGLLTKNPYTTHNFVFLFAFAQSFVATYYLIRHLTGDRRAAVLAGIMYAFCPFAFVRQAHIQLLMIGFLPWCDAGVAPLPGSHDDRARDRARRGDVPDRPGLRVLRHLRRRHDRTLRQHLVRDLAAALEGSRTIGSAWRVAAAVCASDSIAPFFLPYLQMQESSGVPAPAERSILRELRRVARCSSAWAHRWWAALPVHAERGACSPASSRSRSGSGERRCVRDTRQRRT